MFTESVSSKDQAYGFGAGKGFLSCVSSRVITKDIASLNNYVSQSVACHICGMKVGSRKIMTQHINNYHGSYLESNTLTQKSVPFQCQICTKGFFSHTGLTHHMESHTSGFTCQICSKTFSYSRNLKRHIESHHMMKECATCKTLVPKREFNEHVSKCYCDI